jgi:signal transduction histidine kinase
LAQDLPNIGFVARGSSSPAKDSDLARPRSEGARRIRSALSKRERELRILSDVTARIQGLDEVDAILDVVLEEILRAFDLRSAWIFLGDEKEKRLRLGAARGVAPAWLHEVRTRGLDECLCPDVFASGSTMVAHNTTQCPRMPTIVEGLREPVAHACIPLRLEGTSRGVLNVAARLGEQFAPEELRFLETLGRHVCLAVERARHIEAERRYNQQARALAALNKAIGESLDVDTVMKAVSDTALEILGVDRVQIQLGSDPREITVARVAGLAHPELKEGQTLDLVAVGAELQIRALLEQTPFRVDDWRTDERVNRELAERWGVAAALVVPLVARKQTLGLLILARRVPHRWSEVEGEVAEALAAQASVALENARLYADVRQAYQELKDTQDQMIRTEKMAVVGTFASGLAHEVRNPLNSIALQLSLLERRVAPLEAGLSGEIRELIGVIRQEVKRLDNLVGDFLQFARTNRVQYRPASLDALIDEVMRLLRPEARAAGVTLRRQRLGEPLPGLRMDAEKMKQVVINLVQNGIEAMPGGGVIVVESGLQDGRARMVVQDNGPGLPEGLDVFQLFVTTKANGTGLGLSIAQQIVLEHGGEITAASEAGKGATFTVSLPLAPAEGMEAEKVEP